MIMHRFNIWASMAATMIVAHPAYAQTDLKLGGMLTSTTKSISKVPDILTAVAYIAGLSFAVMGIFKFKDHVDNPAQNPLSAGVKKFIAGGMLLSAPYMGKVLKGTLFGTASPELRNSAARQVANSSDGGMDVMITRLVSDAYGPATKLLTGFAYIAALTFLLVGITRLTKTSQEGPRGPAGMGTLMTFLVSGALFSFGAMMATFSNSLFGKSQISTFVRISPNVLSAADAAKLVPVIQAVMAFVTLVGMIAFLRGWFVLRAFAEGNGNATLAQGLTFLFGGALAINLGELITILQNSLGIAGALPFS